MADLADVNVPRDEVPPKLPEGGDTTAKKIIYVRNVPVPLELLSAQVLMSQFELLKELVATLVVSGTNDSWWD